MKEWKPDQSKVKPSEFVGRRMFAKENAPEEAASYNVFLDTRVNDDLSLDRLGDGQLHTRTIEYVSSLCQKAASDQKQAFFGWRAVQHKYIKHSPIRPDPLTVAAHGIDNPYHALLDRTGSRTKQLAFHLSRSLFLAFQEFGQVVEPAGISENPNR